MFREHSGGISVVLLDLLMPGMGGEEAFALIKEINPNVPIILSSGRESGEAAARFSGSHPDLFLPKPYTAERLIEAVASTLSPRVIEGIEGGTVNEDIRELFVELRTGCVEHRPERRTRWSSFRTHARIFLLISGI